MEPIPRVSILMPAYNAAKYIITAIESILNQTFTDFEFIIINDGSTDETEEIIQSYKDSRIRYFKNESNIKLIATLNKGFDLCRGEYIVRMDADDISHLDRIQKQVEFMDENPKVGLSGTAFESFGFINGPYYYRLMDQEIRIRLLHECHMLHPSIILRTSVIRENNIYMTVLHGEDLDFFIRISEHTKLANLPDILINYQQLPESMSKANSEITEINCTKIHHQLFLKLDENFTENDVRIYRKIAYKDFNGLQNQFNQICSIVLRLLEGNRMKNIYDHKTFEMYLKDLWTAIILNVKGYKLPIDSNAKRINKILKTSFSIRSKSLIKNYITH
ncbi:MAG: hypothetical protein RLZ10_1294 [Bacteroidota bacterium]|jgi:glycosyltransferase involved in cell wall biosynthesis